ncbi:MAG: DsbA family protein, partial [bacterium]
MTEAPPPSGEIVVNLVADFVCPWCFIGATRLEQAVAALSEKGETPTVKVVHQPFLLDPSTPPEGRDLREHLAAKYGGDPEAMFARVEGVARESGIALDFSKVRK